MRGKKAIRITSLTNVTVPIRSSFYYTHCMPLSLVCIPCSGAPFSFTLSPNFMATPKGRKLALLLFSGANKKDDWWTCAACEDEMVQSLSGYTNLWAHVNNHRRDLILLHTQSTQPTVLMQSMFYPAKTDAAFAWLGCIVQSLLPFSLCKQNMIRRNFLHMSVSMDSLMLYLSCMTAVVEGKIRDRLPERVSAIFHGWSGVIHNTWPFPLRFLPQSHRDTRHFCSHWCLWATRAHRPPMNNSCFWSLRSPSSPQVQFCCSGLPHRPLCYRHQRARAHEEVVYPDTVCQAAPAHPVSAQNAQPD